MQLPAGLRLSWLLAVLAVTVRTGDARVKLNSIRTVIIRESHAPPVNGSAGEPSDPLDRSKHAQLPPCMSDLECEEGSFCHAPSRNPTPPRCLNCRRRKRRCHRDGMCCRGNRCSNSVCVPVQDSVVPHHISELEQRSRKMTSQKRGRGQGRPAKKAQAGDPCLRSSDCGGGGAELCCARHFWGRICKRVLRGGEACSRQRRKGQHEGLELFQRCDCGAGLSCRPLRDHVAKATVAKATADAAKARLHLCQRD